MSVNAPPPVMPIRDARIERGDVSFCRDAAMVLDLGRRVQRRAHVEGAPAADAWLEIAELPAIGAPEDGLLCGDAPRLARALAHASGVFRPPRVM
jgi:hypothetical protein